MLKKNQEKIATQHEKKLEEVYENNKVKVAKVEKERKEIELC